MIFKFTFLALIPFLNYRLTFNHLLKSSLEYLIGISNLTCPKSNSWFSTNMLHPSTDNLPPVQCSTSQERLSSSDTPHPSVNPVGITFKILYIQNLNTLHYLHCYFPLPSFYRISPPQLNYFINYNWTLFFLFPSTIYSQHGGIYLNCR